jgi:hypothetical protein
MRENQVRLSDSEHASLEKYREEQFGDETVPYGYVLGQLLEKESSNE